MDILIDNWTLQRAAVNIHDTYENLAVPDEDYIRLIEAIILWDDIYFLDSEYSQFWKNILWRFGYERYLTPFDTTKKLGQGDGGDIVKTGALQYSAFCNENNIAYLPCRERAEYLKGCNLAASYINRKDVMNYLDRALLEYYESLNQRFGINKIKFDFPVLFDFVAANTTDRCYLQTALQMRNEHEVVQFRNWLSNFEQKLQQGQLRELENLLAYLPAVIEDLTKVTPQKKTAELQISMSPSISIPISFGGSKNKLVHMDFLRTLSFFAINNRKPFQQY
ncbi:MAG: hypothetical protein IKV90_10060 [Clostridia bacterium]|nr:hypothetical protein [Clostridia bacterium]